MFAAVVDSIYNEVEDLHEAILYQNKLTKNYEFEFS
jgi:hypothetical protein